MKPSRALCGKLLIDASPSCQSAEWFITFSLDVTKEEDPPRMKTTTLSLLVSVAPILCLAQNVTETVKPQSAPKATYLVIYRPGPAWLTGKSVMEQPLKEHGKYMLSLYIKGSMKLAGPLTDNAGGAVLLDVSKEAEARTIVANDPAVQSG